MTDTTTPTPASAAPVAALVDAVYRALTEVENMYRNHGSVGPYFAARERFNDAINALAEHVAHPPASAVALLAADAATTEGGR